MGTAISTTNLPPELETQRFAVRFAQVLATQFVFGLGFASFAIVPKMLETSLGAGPREIGLSMAMLGVGAMVAAPVAGWALDRIGRVQVLRAGAIVTATALVGLSVFLDSPVGRVVSMLIGGSAFVFVFNGTSTLAADLSPPDRLARSIGWIGSAGMVAHAIAPATAEALAPSLGWSRVYLLAAGLCALSVVATLGLTDVVPTGGVTPPVKLSASGRALAPALLMTAFTGAAYAAMFAFHQPLLLARGATKVGAYFIGFTGGALIMRLLLGGLPDRIGLARATRLSLVAYAAIAVAFVYAQPSTLALFGAGHGIAHGVYYPASLALALHVVSARERGMASALMNGAFNGGHALASVGFGLLAEKAGIEAVFVGGGLAALAALGMVGFAHRPTAGTHELAPQRGTSTE